MSRTTDKPQSASKTQRHNLGMLWTSLFLLVVSDGIVTEYLVARRFGREWNPLLVAWVGDDKFLLLKAAGAALAILLLWDISKRNHRIALVVSCCFVLLYGAIVLWNLFLCFLGWL